ncbi:hypothetical protein ACSQ6I_16955 [Anabaena sp. WFMT]|uniref:hypothetical protein n=1 Tax=Anabaena sp. WFMT TaxID=3449730 RepID=UPI003F207C73
MSKKKKKNLGDDFSFPKFKGANGIKSPKEKLLPELPAPLPDIKISEPPQRNLN